MTYVYDIVADAICCLCVCADVAPRGRKVELQRALPHQELERPLQEGPRVGERHRCEDASE
jgi:hypothetical protein